MQNGLQVCWRSLTWCSGSLRLRRPPMSEEARQQAEAEGLTLLNADNSSGYFGVCLNQRGQSKPYQVRVRRGGNLVHLGAFATAEEAALCVARTPEGRAVYMTYHTHSKCQINYKRFLSF